MVQGNVMEKSEDRSGIVTIVGRPNVGKSTLFNTLLGRRIAIVSAQPGVTRDRIIGHLFDREQCVTLIDTGGIRTGQLQNIEEKVRCQAMLSIESSELILFVIDGKEGVTPADLAVAEILRSQGVPVVVVINKMDNDKLQDLSGDCDSLGFEDVHFVSALHKRGVSGLIEEIQERVQAGQRVIPEQVIRTAIVGRPNVGKSSLSNALIGADRSIVSDIPGTTRDAIEVLHIVKGRHILLTDTGGMRKRSKIKEPAEHYSVLRAKKSISRNDIVLLVIDGPYGPVSQDRGMVDMIFTEGKACILVVNKWDCMREVKKSEYAKTVFQGTPLGVVPTVFVSALKGTNVHNLVEAIFQIEACYERRIPTPVLNAFYRGIAEKHSPAKKGRRRFKGYYIVQAERKPPTFVLFANDASLMTPEYRSYICNQIQRQFDFYGVPIRLRVKTRLREKSRSFARPAKSRSFARPAKGRKKR